MRIKLQNVECEFQVSVQSRQRNVYESIKSGINLWYENITSGLRVMGCQIFIRQAGEPVLTKQKHIPTIRIYLFIALTGDCLSWKAQRAMCNACKGDKPRKNKEE